ncbi:aminoglycoside phosphotransferase [Nemania sp. FL0031]|nr:aminoglycoside phosphotransferase [Nemania sp. FL0031]
MTYNNQDGLEWQQGFLDVFPRWTREPALHDIENVCREQLKILPEDPCRVSFYASGAFNKLYRVDYDDRSVIMRVTLPVYPHYKTHGEVATLDWLRHNTTVPVPEVLAFDDSNQNEIGFEWILMEFMPGTTLHQRWRTMMMEQKVAITQRIAEFQMEIFRYGDLSAALKNIGTLHMGNRITFGKMSTIKAGPDQLVSYEFFRDRRVNYDVPRGPFRSSSAWLESHLNIIILEQTEIFEESKDDDDKGEAEAVIAVARRLLSLVPTVFPQAAEDVSEPAFLFHDDFGHGSL